MILYNWILPWGLRSISTWFWSGLVSVNLDKVEDIDTYSMKPLYTVNDNDMAGFAIHFESC